MTDYQEINQQLLRSFYTGSPSVAGYAYKNLLTIVSVTKKELVLFCKDHWQMQYQKVSFQLTSEQEMLSIAVVENANSVVVLAKGGADFYLLFFKLNTAAAAASNIALQFQLKLQMKTARQLQVSNNILSVLSESGELLVLDQAEEKLLQLTRENCAELQGSLRLYRYDKDFPQMVHFAAYEGFEQSLVFAVLKEDIMISRFKPEGAGENAAVGVQHIDYIDNFGLFSKISTFTASDGFLGYGDSKGSVSFHQYSFDEVKQYKKYNVKVSNFFAAWIQRYRICSVVFSPRALVTFASDESGAISCFNLVTGDIISKWIGAATAVRLQLIDEQGVLISYSADGVINLWRVWAPICSDNDQQEPQLTV